VYDLKSRRRLEGKVAIVTGSGSGIGRNIAIAFAGEGAKVCVADMDVASALRVAAAIEAAGGEAMAEAMNVTDERQVDAATDAVAARWGGVDVVVANAGIQHLDTIADVSFDDWKRVLAVHLDGSFLTTRAALRHMIASRRGGAILLMGSVHSYFASQRKGPYVVAKHGLLGLCRTLAKEGAPHNVRANTICPGVVRTPLIERQLPILAKEAGVSEEQVVKDLFLRLTVDDEYTTEAELAEVAVFLAAFPTQALTGQSISVSHGMHML
jgi:3-hydroxybutyrate dehydrogenase